MEEHEGFYDADIQEYLEKHSEENKPFQIDSIERLEWALKKIGRIESETARITAQYKEIVRRNTEDLNRFRARFDEDIRIMCGALLANQKGRTFRTIYGNVVLRNVPRSFRVEDEALALSWAEKNADNLVVIIPETKALDKTGFNKLAKRHLEEAGELLPGAHTTPEREVVSYTFEDEKKS